MSKLICDMDCYNCKFSDCINNSSATKEEEEFSQSYDKHLKAERREEAIRQIDDPKARAIARYRNTPKGKEMIHRMNTNDLAKARFKKYECSVKGIERRKRHEAKPERQKYKKQYMKQYNKMLYEKQKAEKEKQRMFKAQEIIEELAISKSVIIRGKVKNRPRETRILNDVLSILEREHFEWSVKYNEEDGTLTVYRKENIDGSNKD